MTIQTDLYDDMLAQIYVLTNRPDLEGETKIALRTATLNAHMSDMYPRDCVTDWVQLPNTAGAVAINMSTTFPNARGFSKIRATDIQGAAYPEQDWNKIEIVELGDIYDPQYGNLRTNIAYISGDSLVIRLPLNVGGFLVEWMKAPQTKRELYNSWIAQIAPAIIWFWAAAIVMSTNGDDEKARNYLNQIEKFYIPQLKSNFLLGAAR